MFISNLDTYLSLVSEITYKKNLSEQNSKRISRIDERLKSNLVDDIYLDLFNSKSVIVCNKNTINSNTYFEEKIDDVLSQLQSKKMQYLQENLILTDEILLIEITLSEIESNFVKLNPDEIKFVNIRVSQLETQIFDKLTQKDRRTIQSINKKLKNII